jgi:hypothetical protein
LSGDYLVGWSELNIHDDDANKFVNFYKWGVGPIIWSVPIIKKYDR